MAIARARWGLGLCVLGLCVLGGCAPFAPPIRTMHGGAPGRLDPGDMEIGGGPAGVIAGLPPSFGGGGLGYAVRPHLTVESGIDGGEGWTLGWGGVRVPGKWVLRPGVAVAVDGEVGVGAGAGGAGCGDPDEDSGSIFDDDDCPSDGRRWADRPAGGAYLGAGAALRLWPVSIYARSRAQLAGAEHAPPTHWISALVGLHFHILRRADLWGGVAAVHYANRHHAVMGYTWEAGLAFRFDPRVGWRDR